MTLTVNEHHHLPPLQLHLHLALADVVDARLEVPHSKEPHQGLPHHLFKRVKLEDLLNPLSDL